MKSALSLFLVLLILLIFSEVSNDWSFSALHNSLAMAQYSYCDASNSYVQCKVVSPTSADVIVNKDTLKHQHHPQDAWINLDAVLLKQGKDPAIVAARERVLTSLRQRVPRRDS